MDQVFGVERSKGFLLGWMQDVLAIALLLLMFLASVAVTALFYWIKLAVYSRASLPPGWLAWLFRGMQIALHTGLLHFSYRYFPNRAVSRRAALAGALLGSLLLEVARDAFRYYVAHWALVDEIYGPLGFLVLVSMFAYYAGCVVIFGAEYAAALEGAPRGGGSR